mgnify:FL=1
MMENIQLSYVNYYPSKEEISHTIDRKTSKKYINWGEMNNMPQYLWDSYLQCSNLQALVNTVVDYINGDGIETTFTNYDDTETLNDVIKKCTFDLVLFGGFAVECLRDSNKNITQINYINVMNVRVDEDLTTAFLSNQWGSWSGKDVKTLPLFNSKRLQSHFILYYRGNITRNINPVPMWFASLKSVEVLNESRNYNLNNIKNNFNANTIIALNGTSIKSSEMEEIKEKLKAGYSGSDNAGKTLLINNTNSEGKVEITKLDNDKTVDLYKSVQESSIDDLYVAFRINPLLVGINQQTGFNQQDFANSYKLYDKTVVSPLQNQIIKVFNNIGVEITFNKFVIIWED